MKQLIFMLSASFVLLGQDKVDEATSARMRSEELEHSKIMHTLHMLTDRYGPRVTGTPNHEAAAKWAVAEMTSWGMKNGHLEPWDFGHPGWLNESAVGAIVAPVRENVKFEVLAWTPSTKGMVNASAIPVNFEPPAKRRTDEEVKAQYESPNGGRGGRGRGETVKDPNRYTPVEAAEKLDAMLVANGALLRIND